MVDDASPARAGVGSGTALALDVVAPLPSGVGAALVGLAAAARRPRASARRALARVLAAAHVDVASRRGITGPRRRIASGHVLAAGALTRGARAIADADVIRLGRRIRADVVRKLDTNMAEPRDAAAGGALLVRVAVLASSLSAGHERNARQNSDRRVAHPNPALTAAVNPHGRVNGKSSRELHASIPIEVRRNTSRRRRATAALARGPRTPVMRPSAASLRAAMASASDSPTRRARGLSPVRRRPPTWAALRPSRRPPPSRAARLSSLAGVRGTRHRLRRLGSPLRRVRATR